MKKMKFIYSKKATKFCEIFTLLLSYAVPVKSKVKISQNFVAIAEYMNFNVENLLNQTRITPKLSDLYTRNILALVVVARFGCNKCVVTFVSKVEPTSGSGTSRNSSQDNSTGSNSRKPGGTDYQAVH